MKILIYDEKLSGHHLEYLKHYCQAALKMPNDEFIICIPKLEYEAKKDYLPVPMLQKNIRYDLIEDEEVNQICCGSSLMYGIKKTKSIVRKVKKNDVNAVFLTDFITTIPFLLFLMPRTVKVRGIIYRIFLYLKGKTSRLRYAFDLMCFLLMAKSGVMERVFILNDEESAKELNDMFHTTKFKALADPVVDVDLSKVVNLRKELGVPDSNTIYFHFGALSERKGTLEILKAIIMADAEILHNKTFILAGVVRNDIRDRFYSLLSQAREKAQIIVFDEFCSYDKLNSLCHTSDIIIMPYSQTELSSGVLGYAAQFEKPVIGPCDGLIGKLIRNYHLGITLSRTDANGIADILGKPIPHSQPKEYVIKNKKENFIDNLWDGN